MSWNDWRSGSTNPVYNGLGPGPNNYGQNKINSKPKDNRSFEEIQNWVKDACANCISRHLKEASSIWCMKWKGRNAFSFSCDLYEKDASLDGIREK